jgi:hypothetical protein
LVIVAAVLSVIALVAVPVRAQAGAAAPSVPSGRRVLSCTNSCTAPIATRSTRPVLTAISTVPANRAKDYTFQVCNGQSAKPTSCATVSQLNQSGAARVQTPGLSDGGKEFRVRACTSNTLSACSAWSSWVLFTVDTVAPLAPTLTATGPLSTGSGYAGAVGDSVETVRFTPHDSRDQVRTYQYSLNGVGSPDIYPATGLPLACGATVLSYSTVCATAVNGPRSIQLAALDNNTTLTVWSVDLAGNLSPASYVTFYALSSTSPRTGHSWPMQDLSINPAPSACLKSPVPDVGSHPLPLSLTGSVCWADDEVDHAVSPVLSFDGTPAVAGNLTAAVSTSKSFTISVWAKPSRSGPGIVDPVISQGGTHISPFFLMNSNGHWVFCMPTSDSASAADDCVAFDFGVAVGSWTHLIAEWDAVNHQLRLGGSTDSGVGTMIVGHHDPLWLPSYKTTVGRVQRGTSLRSFDGEIFDPVLVPGIPSTGQLSELGNGTPPPNF